MYFIMHDVTEVPLCPTRFKHIAISVGASDQQRGGQPSGAAAGAVFPAAPQPPPAEPDAAFPQSHESAAVHGNRHTLAQSVTFIHTLTLFGCMPLECFVYQLYHWCKPFGSCCLL